MTRQEAEQLIRERGFRIWAILGDENSRLWMKVELISLWTGGRIISVWSGWFQGLSFKWHAPECSPFSWDKQFYRMYGRFKSLIEEIVYKTDGGNRD